MKFTLNSIFQAVSLFVSVWIATSCSPSHKHDGELTIGVSIPPMAAIVDELTNRQAKVITMVSADANPEIYEPAVKDFVDLNDADAVFITGRFAYEDRLKSILPKSVEAIDVTSGIDLLYGTHTGCTSHAHNHHNHSHHADEADPHVWTSYRNTAIIARNIADYLSKVDPDNATQYAQRLERVTARIDSLDKTTTTLLTADSIHRSFIVWHPSLSYFANDYNLEQVAVGAENKEASVAQMKQVIDRLSGTEVAAMFIQSNYDSRRAGNLASQLNLTPVVINPLDYDWEQQLKLVTDALAH